MISISGPGSLWGSAWQISASGMQDAHLRMAVTAHNVANGNTDGFVPDRVDSVARQHGGVDSLIISGEKPSAEMPADYRPPSQTNYATEGVNLLLAKVAFEASAKAFKAHDSATEAIIDAVG